MYLHFASVVGDHAKVVEHWVMEGNWLKALEVLVGQAGNLFTAKLYKPR